MIRATFAMRDGRVAGFRIAGHAGYAESGADIVCSAVSVASHMTVRGIVETLGLQAEASADDQAGTMTLRLTDTADACGQAFLRTLFNELVEIAGQYPDYLTVHTDG